MSSNNFFLAYSVDDKWTVVNAPFFGQMIRDDMTISDEKNNFSIFSFSYIYNYVWSFATGII